MTLHLSKKVIYNLKEILNVLAMYNEMTNLEMIKILETIEPGKT